MDAADGNGGRVVSVAVGRDHLDPPPTRLAFGLALLVGLAVFGIFLAVRRTFGVKR